MIHFNFGLHDIAYRHPDSAEFGNRDKVRGVISVTPEAYEKNLRQIVQLLKDAGATLIWASTTLVPAGEVGRFEGDEIKYNAIAKKIMDENGILINDLHALTAQFPAEYFAGPGDVHYAPQGNEHLAAQVVKFISKVL
ncbi:MAG: SGNH/GDSL hydrolase family protein [Clostridia bacterium]